MAPKKRGGVKKGEAKRGGSKSRIGAAIFKPPSSLETLRILGVEYIKENARSLRQQYLQKIHYEAIKSGDQSMASSIVGAMDESLEEKSAEFRKWFYKAIGDSWLVNCLSSLLEAKKEGDKDKQKHSSQVLELGFFKDKAKHQCLTFIREQNKGLTGEAAAVAMSRVEDEDSHVLNKWLTELRRFDLALSSKQLQLQVHRREVTELVVKRAKVLRKFHLDKLLNEAVNCNHDPIVVEAIMQANKEGGFNQDSMEGMLWIDEAKKYAYEGYARADIPHSFDLIGLEAHKKSYWDGVKLQCANVEKVIRDNGCTRGWIDFWQLEFEGDTNSDMEEEFPCNTTAAAADFWWDSAYFWDPNMLALPILIDSDGDAFPDDLLISQLIGLSI